MYYGNSTILTSRLGRVVGSLERVADTLTILRLLGGSEKVLHPETRRDRWLSEHLDRAFTKTPEESDLPSIMGVASSKGLQYIARVYGVHCVPNVLTLKTRSRVMSSFLSQPLIRPSFWALFAENLEESKDRLLALPPSQGQTLSNQELFASILEDAQRAIRISSPILTDSEDDDSEQLSPGASDSF